MNNNSQLTYDKLINLVDYRKGKKPEILDNIPHDGYVPYVDIEAFERGIVNRYTNDKNVPICDKDKDILVVWDGRVGLVGKASGAVGSTLMKLTPKKLNRDYLLLFLQSKFRDINSNFRGTIIPHVNPDYFWNIEVPIPTPEQQITIAHKLNRQLPDIEFNNKKVIYAKNLITKFRKTIVSAAVTGKLTGSWRKQHPNIANPLLTLNTIKHPNPYEIDSWYVTSLEAITEKIVDCPHSTPKWTPQGRICLRTTNFKQFNLDLSEVRYVSEETFNQRNARLVPEAGDVLYSREGGILGIACQIPGGSTVCLGQRMMLIRGNKTVVNNEYITLFLNSEIILNKVKDLITGSAAPHLNVGDVREFSIYLPPLLEQNEILRLVKYYFNILDNVDKQIVKTEAMVSRLTQAILAKTFTDIPN